MYNFICNNYCDGDDIILTGFSRGAFTARSVADLIAWAGLLTPDGLDQFFAIFKDYTSLGDGSRDVKDYLCKIDPYAGQQGKARLQWEAQRKEDYQTGLRDVSAQLSSAREDSFSPACR